MTDKDLSQALRSAKKEFLTNLSKELDSILSTLNEMNQKQAGEIDLEKVGHIVREIHNIKSVAGSYDLEFIFSAARNILAHTSYIYDLEGSEIADFSVSIEILKLVQDFVKDISAESSEEHKGKLDDILNTTTSGKKVLVVEKDRQLLGHLQKVLNKSNMSFSSVSSGVEAFNTLLSEKFDLLITDLHVGKLDGPSLIATNRVSNGINKDIKTILLSVSYFDLLPSISMPDYFISKNENILSDLKKTLEKFKEEEMAVENEETVKIMCLDDDSNIHDLLKISFSSHNISYTKTENGEEFKKCFLENHPDLVILDLILENESGVQVIKSMKESGINFDVPVIVLTSLDGDLKSELLSEIPFIIGNLSKPFTPKSMAAQVLDLYRQNKKSFYQKI